MFLYFLILNCSIINSALDRNFVKTVIMEKGKIVIFSSSSGIQVSLEFLLLSDHIKLVNKY